MQNFVKSTSSNSQLSPDSTDEGDPYYPVPNPRNQELYAKYQVGKVSGGESIRYAKYQVGKKVSGGERS